MCLQQLHAHIGSRMERVGKLEGPGLWRGYSCIGGGMEISIDGRNPLDQGWTMSRSLYPLPRDSNLEPAIPGLLCVHA